MRQPAVTPDMDVPGIQSLPDSVRKLTDYWWVLLVSGIAWVAASLVILQFNHASMTTVGILVGILFLGAAIENFALATMDVPARWAWALFGGLFVVCAVICFVNPTSTFAGLAEMLGFLFLVVGVWWIIRAFVELGTNPLWWLGLLSGILMTILAFWTSGAFFIQKAYLLLVLAGVWALMQGITSIVRAFEARAAREAL